jgi:hypothetical protein
MDRQQAAPPRPLPGAILAERLRLCSAATLRLLLSSTAIRKLLRFRRPLHDPPPDAQLNVNLEMNAGYVAQSAGLFFSWR